MERWFNRPLVERWINRPSGFYWVPLLFPIGLFLALLGITSWFSYQSYSEMHALKYRQGGGPTSIGSRPRSKTSTSKSHTALMPKGTKRTTHSEG